MEYEDTLPLLVKEGNELILNIETLKSLLLNDKVKNLPVCVISIAGALRMGKSFLLNLILRYFMKKGWETHDGQWLMGDDEDNLNNGIKWRGGSKGHTQGIMAYGGTITVDKKDGSKVAIILLDTQGNFDNKETKTKSARVFALSNLCSSLQIFNLFKQIQSNDLEYLQTFVEFSKGPKQNSNVANNSENTKAFFQDLQFVVRDWVHWDYPHGSDGGQEYLKNLQSDIEASESEEESMMKYLQKTFTKIGCYLMPPPSEKVQNNRPDDKPLYAADLGESFFPYIIKFMEEYLNPEILTHKTIGLSGETTCKDLYGFIVGCAESILSGEGPILMSEMQAIAEINNTRCRDKKLAWYKETVEYNLQNTISWNDYDILLKQTKQATKQQLLQAIWYGNSNPLNTADDLLDGLFNEADLISMTVMQDKRLTILHPEIEKWLTSSILLLEGRYIANQSDLEKLYSDTLQKLSINLDGRDSDFIIHKLDASKERFRQCYEDKTKVISNRGFRWTREKWMERVDTEYKDQLPLLVKEGKELILNKEALKALLLNDEVKNLPVCVISIAGALRMGKSFLLNLILQYFIKKGWETQDGQWLMGDVEDNLNNGINYKGGCEGHTQGIIAWGKTIIVDKEDGSKVAIILLDTQGNFDTKETKTKSARVFALSNLCSSLQIFNVFRQIQSHDLEYLQTFVEFSKQPISNQNNNVDGNSRNRQTFFQDLLFVVRDWVFRNHQHGSEGGQECLEEIQTKIEFSKSEEESVMKYLQRTFTKIGCYLMPTPGEKVQNDRLDNEPLLVSDLGKSFSSHVIQFVEKYLNPEKLTNKTVGLSGETTCQSLYEFIEASAEKILSGEGPVLMSEMQAIAETNNSRCRDKKRAWYGEAVKKKIQESTISWDDYDIVLQQAKKTTTIQLRKEIWFGSSNSQNKVNELLDGLFVEADSIAITLMREKRVHMFGARIEEWMKSSTARIDSCVSAKQSDLDAIYLVISKNLSIKLDVRDSDSIANQLKNSKKKILKYYEAKIKAIAEINCSRCRDKNRARYKEAVENIQESTISWDDYDIMLRQAKETTKCQLLQEIGSLNLQITVDELLDGLFVEADSISITLMREKREHMLGARIEAWMKDSTARLNLRVTDILEFNLPNLDIIYRDSLKNLSIKLDVRDSNSIANQLETSKNEFRECYEAKTKMLDNRVVMPRILVMGAILGGAVGCVVAGPLGATAGVAAGETAIAACAVAGAVALAGVDKVINYGRWIFG